MSEATKDSPAYLLMHHVYHNCGDTAHSWRRLNGSLQTAQRRQVRPNFKYNTPLELRDNSGSIARAI